MKEKNLSKRILIGITGNKNIQWQSKLEEIEKFKIYKVALFCECFRRKQRESIYRALLTSKIKEIPLVHIRNDMDKKELEFLSEKFHSRYFTIHEDGFKILRKWKGFYKYLFLEMNTDNFVSQSVEVDRIGGFCVDLAHFKVEITKWSKEFEYIFKRRKTSHYFRCNHLSGYDSIKNTDLHTVRNAKAFNYLKNLPEFLFGDIIAIEIDNSITEQLKYKAHILNLLSTL